MTETILYREPPNSKIEANAIWLQAKPDIDGEYGPPPWMNALVPISINENIFTLSAPQSDLKPLSNTYIRDRISEAISFVSQIPISLQIKGASKIMTEQIDRIERKIDRLLVYVHYMNQLQVVISNGGTVRDVNGWTPGRTDDGAAFIRLYGIGDHLQHKLCRVYQEEFHKLPKELGIKPGIIPADAPSDNPTKKASKKAGIYHDCRPFKIATVEGKETPTGPEIRFFDVINLANPFENEPPTPPAVLTQQTTPLRSESQHLSSDQVPSTLPPEENINDVLVGPDPNHKPIKPAEKRLYYDGSVVEPNAYNTYDDYVATTQKIPVNVVALRQWYFRFRQNKNAKQTA